MRRKIESTILWACALALGSSAALASSPKFNNPLGFEETIPTPEIDFTGFGPVGIGTAVVAIAYGVEKVYRKVAGRKQS